MGFEGRKCSIIQSCSQLSFGTENLSTSMAGIHICENFNLKAFHPTKFISAENEIQTRSRVVSNAMKVNFKIMLSHIFDSRKETIA